MEYKEDTVARMFWLLLKLISPRMNVASFTKGPQEEVFHKR